MGDQATASTIRFPALDPEPPPRSLLFRLAGAVGAGAAGTLAALIVWLIVSGSGGSRSSLAPGDQVVFLTQQGTFGTARPDGTAATALPALGTHIETAGSAVVGSFAIASPDGRFFVAIDGAVVAFNGHSLALQPHRVDVKPPNRLAFHDAFANHDQYLVVLDEGTSVEVADTPISLYNWRSGTQRPLGVGDAAAGDPAAPGAFVSVAGNVSSDGIADSRVELRDAGLAPVVLVTASKIDALLGLPGSTQVTLDSFPDPTGRKIAVIAGPIGVTSDSATYGVVVLDRSGRILGSLKGPSVPQSGYGVSWSPDGSELLYVAVQGLGPAVAEWEPQSGRPPAIRADPATVDTPGSCSWSPTGASVLCQALQFEGPSHAWVTGSASGGPLEAIEAPGAAVDWVEVSSPGTK